MLLLTGVVLAGGCFFLVFYWWSEGSLEASDALLAAVVLCGLVFGLFASQQTWQRALAFIPLAAIGVYLLHSFRSGSIRAYYKRRCQDYIRAIQSDPRNLAAREHFADALYNMGELDRAVDEIKVAADMGAGMECQYKLGKWSKERYFRDTANPICRWCQTENEQGARQCSKCGSDLPYDNALSRWLGSGQGRASRYLLILATGAAVVAVSLAVLPGWLALVPLALCLLALAGWSLVNSARS